MDFKSLDGLLSVVTTALGVVAKIGDAPGVSAIPYINTITSAASALQFAIKSGKNVAADVAAFAGTFSDGLPSQEKIDALDERIAALRTKLHMPLPEKEEGEPE